MKPINILTIAGTDPTGGAGIQADIKTISALKAYSTSVITAIVAQNTYSVQSIFSLDSKLVLSQLNSVLNDVKINSCKIGMVGNSKIIKCISNKLKEVDLPCIVLDTVMYTKNGFSLLSKNSIKTLIKYLFPISSIITPNLLEASILLNCKIAKSEEDMQFQGRELLKLGSKAVLLKGGHLNNTYSPDWLFTEKIEKRFSMKKINTLNTHGTGCCLSSALATIKPNYKNWIDPIKKAKKWLQGAIINSNNLNVGTGRGPINHFYKWW
ncbi:bifunctional hydroxymethylpyrimidine kinase/phosphomethylpyrimidine kinase [Buchnera aphidicola (Mindarus keteleerifoliae)]|uniref:bifunctional hydroxymethylpyrimidine kinase/phosphomethylpyrimidine kinase n=1 Tax=Buchnera aphidicola TaxID=9 RepID=UPI0031B6CDF4